MTELEALYQKFPVILQQKLLRNEISLPHNTEFQYAPIKAYRAIERTENDYTAVSRNDFRSYFELKKNPKNMRGVRQNLEKDPHYYGVSTYMSEEPIIQQMHFPNPKKKMAEGYVYMEGGPQQTRSHDGHICWWLFADADVSGFVIKR